MSMRTLLHPFNVYMSKMNFVNVCVCVLLDVLIAHFNILTIFALFI